MLIPDRKSHGVTWETKTNTLFYFERCDHKIVATVSTALDNDDEKQVEKWNKNISDDYCPECEKERNIKLSNFINEIKINYPIHRLQSNHLAAISVVDVCYLRDYVLEIIKQSSIKEYYVLFQHADELNNWLINAEMEVFEMQEVFVLKNQSWKIGEYKRNYDKDIVRAKEILCEINKKILDFISLVNKKQFSFWDFRANRIYKFACQKAHEMLLYVTYIERKRNLALIKHIAAQRYVGTFSKSDEAENINFYIESINKYL